MVYNSDENYLMLSGIQHFEFCKRQWALIHIEQQWEENVRTIQGQHIHEKTDKPFLREKRGNKLIVRAMPIRSNDLMITGVCDVVEFIEDNQNGIHLQDIDGKYKAYPVEYKRGKPKKHDSDVLQLVAQAMCIEEMLLCTVDVGYLYYHEIKHRVEIKITEDLKIAVRKVVREMHEYFKRRHTPKVKTGSFCKNCSLQKICLPEMMNKKSVKSYIEGRIYE